MTIDQRADQIDALLKRPMTPAEIAEASGISVDHARYMLRRMLEKRRARPVGAVGGHRIGIRPMRWDRWTR